MRKIIIVAVLGVLMVFTGIPLKAQAPLVHGNPNAWFLLLNHYRFAPKWRIGNEFHIRRDDWLKDQQQLLIRPYLEYKLSDKVDLTAGYTYILTGTYGDFANPINQPEHNIWEQLVIKNKIGKNSISHRYRLENRFRGNIATSQIGEDFIDGYSFSNRFRYRLTYKRPLSDLLFVHVFDEVWINMSNKFQIRSFDRNWLYAGLGAKFLDGGNVQLAYVHQWGENNPSRFEQHHTLQLTIQYDFN